MSLLNTALTWLSVMFTLMVLSFLYKENPLFRFAEFTAVGAGAGLWFVTGAWSIYNGAITQLGKNPLLIVPILLGILFFTVFTKWPWASRYPIALLVGAGVGVAARSAVEADFLGQITSTMVPLVKAGDAFASLNNILILVGTVCTVLYFFFMREQKGAFGILTKVGRVFMMVAFASGFGSAILSGIQLMVPRIQFLLKDWLHIMS